MTRLLLSPAARAQEVKVETDPMATSGNAWSFGKRARIMRPRDAAPGRRGIHAMSPWVDADLHHGRRGRAADRSSSVGSGSVRSFATSRSVKASASATVEASDRDQDGIADQDDHCPDVAGQLETSGCPPYEKVVVLRDKLEVKEKITLDSNAVVRPAP